MRTFLLLQAFALLAVGHLFGQALFPILAEGPRVGGGGGGSSTLNTGLIAYWKMDEASGTREDSVGSNDLLDSTSTGSAAGKLGNGGDFEAGTPNWLSAADSPELSIGDQDFTIALWVKPESLTTFNVLFSKNGLDLAIFNNASGVVTFSVGGGGPSPSTGGELVVGSWSLIIAWYDAAGDLKNVSVNNAFAVADSGVSPTDNGLPLVVGAFDTSGTFPADGMIDEVGIWDRVLTSDERTELYNSGVGKTCCSF